MTDDELYARGMKTVAACCSALADGTGGAAVHGLPGAVVAVFRDEPTRSIYNNAILERGLAPSECAAALHAVEELYASAGVGRFAVWAHETDEAMREELSRRGYVVDITTRAMAMPPDDDSVRESDIELVAPTWSEHLRIIGAPQGLLDGLDPTVVDLRVARLGNENVATGFGFDHEEDCGIYNVATLENMRGRGLGTALTAKLIRGAHERGCRTVSLQSTPMAERMYAALGFRDLGRIVEYVPARDRGTARR